MNVHISYIAQVKQMCGLDIKFLRNIIDKWLSKAYIRPNNFERKHKYEFIRN